MRIAIYENLPPGGARRTAYEFGRFLAGRHQVDLYRLGLPSPQTFDLSPVAAHVYPYEFAPLLGLLNGRLARGRLAPRSLTIFGALQRVHRRMAVDLAGRGYDLVLAHTDSMSQSPYLLRWLPAGLGVYYCHEVLRVSRELAVRQAHRHKLAGSRPPLGMLRLIEDRWVLVRWQREDLKTLQSAMQVIANSGYTRDQIWSAYARAATVSSPGVDTETFAPSPDGSRAQEILSIGSPLAIKGHDMVVSALATVPESDRPRLRIIASSLDRAEALQSDARRQNVDIVFDSGISDAVLAERYRRALVTVCAARMEPFGLTPLESMASGTPVIAINEAGFRETVVHGETGLLVDPDVRSLGDAIAGLVADQEKIRRLGRQARAHVLGQWTWGQRGERLEAVLAGLVQRSAAG